MFEIRRGRQMVKQAFCIASLLILSGCGGGGGSGATGTSATLAPFVNWDTSLKANQSFQVSGISAETTMVLDPGTASFLSGSDAVERSVTVTGTVNGTGASLTKFGLTSSSGRALSFTSGIIKEDGYFSAENLDKSETLLLADPTDLDWKYQSFGYWENKSQNFSLSTSGYYSIGVVTPDSVILGKTGTATYTGASFFSYSEVGSAQVLVQSNVTATADFRDRSLTLNSIFSGGPPQLNFSGTLRYGDGGSSTFRGTLENTDGTMSGPASGRFYGPAAQEIGGVFSLKSPSGDQRIFGAFGAAQ